MKGSNHYITVCKFIYIILDLLVRLACHIVLIVIKCSIADAPVISSLLMTHKILRSTDITMNRIGERLRLLKEVSRLVVDEFSHTKRLKAMQHDLSGPVLPFQQKHTGINYVFGVNIG